MARNGSPPPVAGPGFRPTENVRIGLNGFPNGRLARRVSAHPAAMRVDRFETITTLQQSGLQPSIQAPPGMSWLSIGCLDFLDPTEDLESHLSDLRAQFLHLRKIQSLLFF